MTFTKSLMLGSAAALVAVAGANAADLPSKKAAPAQYVKICDAAGAGYFYIPGSDTCLKISGYAELNLVSRTVRNSLSMAGVVTAAAATKNNNTYGLDAEIQLDAKTKTSFGDLHTYVAFEAPNGAGAAYIDNAYLEWAGITAGKHESFYHNMGGLYSGYQTADYGTNLLAYTASFGGGFSATVSFEDSIGPGRSLTTETAGNASLNGTRIPDIIGALNVKQGWGAASLIGGFHQTTYNVVAPAGNKSAAGFGVMGFVSINLPMLAAGDSISFQGAWERNALRFAGLGASSAFGSGNGFSNAPSDIYVTAAGSLAAQTGYSFVADLKHNWTPVVSTEIEGSYGKVSYAGSAALTSLVTNGYSEWRIGQVTKWTPVKNLEIGLDTAYARYTNKWNATAGAANAKSNSDMRVQLRLHAGF